MQRSFAKIWEHNQHNLCHSQYVHIPVCVCERVCIRDQYTRDLKQTAL